MRATWLSPRALALLRIVTGLLYFEHGTGKLFGFPHLEQYDGITLFSLAGVAGVLETFGSPFIIVGLWTRPVAFVLSGQMAVAYFIFHFPRSVFPLLNNGDSAILFCFIFLYLAAAGAGAWSLDVWLRRRHERPT